MKCIDYLSQLPKLLGILCLLYLSTYEVSSQCSDNLLMNGSLNSTIGEDKVARYWVAENYLPDVNNASGTHAIPDVMWTGEVIDSQDGGTWQNLEGSESLFQSVELQVGDCYRLCFEYALQGISFFNTTISSDPTAIEIFLNDDLLETTPKDTTPYTWDNYCTYFIADQVSNKIGFEASRFEYIGIDGICLTPICVDCAGTLNGSALLDDCDLCLQPDDPTFNQSCLDCAGSLNGNAIIDDCGVCLMPDDPEFNQSCVDCNGTVFGTAETDDCGRCLEPDDPDFGQPCALYFPNIISLSNQDDNSEFRIFSSDETDLEVINYSIFDRWVGLMFESSNFNLREEGKWWNGQLNKQEVNTGVYVYKIEILTNNQKSEIYAGELLVIK